MIRLAARLGLDSGEEAATAIWNDYTFPRSNETFETRSPALHRWARRLRPLMPRHRITLTLYRGYLALQRHRRRSERPPEDVAALAEIDGLLAEDNQRLAKALDLDLGAWE